MALGSHEVYIDFSQQRLEEPCGLSPPSELSPLLLTSHLAISIYTDTHFVLAKSKADPYQMKMCWLVTSSGTNVSPNGVPRNENECWRHLEASK